MSVYDYIVKDYSGKNVKLSKYEGKVLLIVNTATKCGFTKQYPALQELYKKYKKEGFEILDFPQRNVRRCVYRTEKKPNLYINT